MTVVVYLVVSVLSINNDTVRSYTTCFLSKILFKKNEISKEVGISQFLENL